VKKHY